MKIKEQHELVEINPQNYKMRKTFCKHTGTQKSKERSLHKKKGYPIVEYLENSGVFNVFFFSFFTKKPNWLTQLTHMEIEVRIIVV